LEKGYPLYGNELTTEISPTSNTVSKWCVKNKNCIGYKYFKTNNKKQIGIILKNNSTIRDNYELYNKNIDGINLIGKITSSCYSPILKKSIGIALVNEDFSDSIIFVSIKGKLIECNVTKIPFV
jgi:aminomethyltransferase